MPRYDYACQKCKCVFEHVKAMSAPDPKSCPNCKGRRVARYFQPEGNPGVYYRDRPPWTYKESLKYKTGTWNGTTVKIDPSKHGDIGAWHCPGELVKEKAKKRGSK